MILRRDSHQAEVQIRTTLQHAWAQLTEKLADKFGQDLKYGAGPDIARELVQSASSLVESVEALEVAAASARQALEEEKRTAASEHIMTLEERLKHIINLDQDARRRAMTALDDVIRRFEQ